VICASVQIKPVSAAEVVEQVYLDKPTITKGYTVVTPDTNLRVGVVAGVVTEPITVTIKSLTPEEIALPAGLVLVSGVYEYDFIGQTNPLLLSKPYQLALKYTSDNFREKSIYYWNKPTGTWVKLPSQVKSDIGEIRGISPLPYSKIAVFETAINAHVPLIMAVDPINDVTAAFDDGSASARLPKGATDGPATLTLKNGEMPSIMSGLTSTSPLFIFDVTDTKQAKLNQPITLTIKYDSNSIYRRNIYYWDRTVSKWILLPSTVDYDRMTITARTVLKYALVGVFETNEPAVQEGLASWYIHRKYPNGAANNVFGYDAKLRVTNLDNQKSTVVTVKSSGPFVPSRVIDLVKTAFSEIANTRQGVIRVRVEKI